MYSPGLSTAIDGNGFSSSGNMDSNAARALIAPLGKLAVLQGSGAAIGSSVSFGIHPTARTLLIKSASPTGSKFLAAFSSTKLANLEQGDLIPLGTTPVADDGTYLAKLNLPASITPGSYILVTAMFNASGATVVLEVPMEVVVPAKASPDTTKAKAGKRTSVNVLANDTVAGKPGAQTVFIPATLCLVTGSGSKLTCLPALKNALGVFVADRTTGAVSFTANSKAKAGTVGSVQYAVRDSSGAAVSSKISVHINR